MAPLRYRPGSTMDPSTDHGDGVHSLLVTDILQRGTPPQVYRALTDIDEVHVWLDDAATVAGAGVAWTRPELTGTTSGLVHGERIAMVLAHPGWATPESSAEIRLWPTPRATLVIVNHRGLAAADLDRARGIWAPEILHRLRGHVLATADRSSPVGVVIGGTHP